MSGALELLQRWLWAAERLAARLPELSGAIARGSWPAAVVTLALGVALLAAGVRLGRVLAAAAAAGIGWIAGSTFVSHFELWNLPPQTPAWVGALVLGVVALGLPELYPVLLGLVPGALLGMRFAVGGKAWLGALAGAVVLALLLVWLRRLVLAATAAAIGAVLVVSAAVALGARVPRVAALAQRPLLLAAVAGALAIAGTAWQLGTTRRVRPAWAQRGQPLRD